MIATRQQPDGHWGTPDVSPPQSYSPVTATATGLHAIRIYSAADVRVRTERARAWLASARPRDTEEGTMQNLGSLWAGAPNANIETNYPYGHDQFISAMGASWAIRS